MVESGKRVGTVRELGNGAGSPCGAVQAFRSGPGPGVVAGLPSAVCSALSISNNRPPGSGSNRSTGSGPGGDVEWVSVLTKVVNHVMYHQSGNRSTVVPTVRVCKG